MLEIKTFDRSDIPAALELCGQVNWNHVAADWERCLDLNPEACLGGFEDGKMKAACTMLPFGTVGWIGTFLVDQALRGKGYGKMIFQAMLETAQRQGMTCLGLDSSDLGRPIYLKHEFQITDQGIELWSGPATGGEALHVEARPLEPSDWESLLAFDRASVQVSRERQLRLLAGQAGASGRVMVEGGELCAFGFSRPGRLSGAIGPVVARDASCASRIVSALMIDRRRFDGEKPVAVALLGNADFQTWLVQHGFKKLRRNIRMFHPASRAVLSGPAVFVSTGLGMG